MNKTIINPIKILFMKLSLKYIFALGLVMLVYSGYSQVSLSQSVISSTGSFYSTSNANYSYTAGEIAVATQSSSSIVLTQGFHQPLASTTTTVIPQYTDGNFSVNVFPNPTLGSFSIEIVTEEETDLTIVVVDILGKLCGKVNQVNQFEGRSIYKCELNRFSSGIYFVKVSSKDDKYNKTIRVQKID